MKKLSGILTAAALCISVSGFAQENDTQTLKEDINATMDTVSTNVKEAAAKGKAMIKDQVYADKVGPNGETVYIDQHSRYYYIDEQAEKVYVKESDLKDNPEE